MNKLETFYLACWEEFINHAGRRTGQNMFNALYNVFPDVADEIRGTEFDPFYIYGSCITFLEKIEELLIDNIGNPAIVNASLNASLTKRRFK